MKLQVKCGYFDGVRGQRKKKTIFAFFLRIYRFEYQKYTLREFTNNPILNDLSII